MSSEYRNILLLNISQSDAGNLPGFLCADVNFLKASDVNSAIEILRSVNIDLILTDADTRSSILRKTAKDPSLSSVPVLSVERSFNPVVSTHDIEISKGRLFEGSSLFCALQSVYPLAVTCNLTKDACSVIHHEDYSKDIDKNISVFSELVSLSATFVSPCHRSMLLDSLSVDRLCDSLKNGGTVRITYRSRGNDNCMHWFETIVLNIANPYDDDVLAIVLSRVVDEQKNFEERILKTLDETTEELEKQRYYRKFSYDALPAAIIMYYLDWRPMPYINGNLFLLFGYSEEEVAELHKNGLRGMVFEEDLAKANANLMKAHADGVDRVTNEYRMIKKDGSIAYVQEIASRFVDEDGSVGFIGVFTDISERHEMLVQLRRKEKIMSIVGEHSERIVYYYDIATDDLRAINDETAIRTGLADFCVNPLDTLQSLSLIHSDSVQQLNKLFDMLHSGADHFSSKLHMNCLDGVDRWFDACFTAMPDDDGKPLGAVITLLDITERHDHEISHARYMDSIANAHSNQSVFFEFDLTSDLVEKQIGIIEPFTESCLDKSYIDTVEYLTRNISKKKQQRRVNAYLSKEMLLEAYDNAQRRITDDWPIMLDDGRKIWIHCSVHLVNDPYTHHIKMLMSLSDVTENMLKQLNIIHKAENDGLTGLYNRSTIENKIKESLEADYHNSLFILIDLDDLKAINDTLGHAQGDRAICAISDELIATFKGKGMEGRIGGDEFLVFVPNFPESEDVDVMISTLLRRLNAIKIGEDDSNSLHCSIGIAIADDEAHDFASLYKRADIALYHVKQNGKNDCAHFSSDMLCKDFRYKPYEFKATSSSPLFDNVEFRRMMVSLGYFYPQILLSNLTKNTICVLASAKDFSTMLPREGTLDSFLDIASKVIHPENAGEILPAITREAQLAEYKSGTNYLYYQCRLSDSSDNTPRRITFIILFYKNADGDICGLILLRRASEKPLRKDVARLQKALALSADRITDFCCVINPSDGEFSSFHRSSSCRLPSEGVYDDNIAPCVGISLENVLSSLRDGTDFEFLFADGKKKAVFSRIDSDSNEIIMIISKL